MLNLIRIKKSNEYSRIAKTAKRLHLNSMVIMYNLLPDAGILKAGLTVSRRVGGAVKRNYCKRVLREILREAASNDNIRPVEVVLIARSTMLTRNYSEIRDEVMKGLGNIK